jgi:hypothetical protein
MKPGFPKSMPLGFDPEGSSTQTKRLCAYAEQAAQTAIISRNRLDIGVNMARCSRKVDTGSGNARRDCPPRSGAAKV